jgi:hypothetical protein
MFQTENPVTHRGEESRRNNATLHDTDGGNWLNMVSLLDVIVRFLGLALTAYF